MDKFLECPICLMEMDSPAMLPCQHCFCFACLSCYMIKQNDICPICRQQFKKEDIVRNLLLEQILNSKNPQNTNQRRPSDAPQSFSMPSNNRSKLEVSNTLTSVAFGIGGILVGLVGAVIAGSFAKKSRR